MNDEVQKKINELSAEGKITCAQAEMVAKEYGLSRREVGEIINELELKIISCQLGCF
ncbi:MAG: hypothetical protein GWP07_06515 [Xanthomonadaceae bacterium]|nr:hypothetical protein [Xanthomonadaceae bacterium]